MSDKSIMNELILNQLRQNIKWERLAEEERRKTKQRGNDK